MPAERYYTDQNFHAKGQAILEGQEFRHLATVMRTRPGEVVELVNGKGLLAHAEVEQIQKKQVILHIQSVQLQPRPAFSIVLAQAIPRINRLDFIIEKGTELGLDELWLFPGKHSERKSLTGHQLERMEALTVSAMKQCGRLWLPRIAIKPPLQEWKELELPAYFGDLSPKAPLFLDALSGIRKHEMGLIFFTGPESGFEDSEEDKLRELGAKGVKLHSNILRTDTASIAALSLITCR